MQPCHINCSTGVSLCRPLRPTHAERALGGRHGVEAVAFLLLYKCIVLAIGILKTLMLALSHASAAPLGLTRRPECLFVCIQS